MREIKLYFKISILIIVIISIVLTIFRVTFYFIAETTSENSFLYIMIQNRDLNFRTIYNLMDNGLFNYYKEHPLVGQKGLYLYFWYFLFYPFHVIPFEISIYIWDLLRLISTIYIISNIKKISENDKEILMFLLFTIIGYFADMYLNNTNWLIQLLLFESYIQLKKDKKLISGMLFTIAMFKIITIIFPFILIVIKKIKAKELKYFFLPLFCTFLPYFIFPDYFLQMVGSWINSVNLNGLSIDISIFFMIWRFIQMPHLMFVSLLALIVLENIEDDKMKERMRDLIYISIFVIWIGIWLIYLELIVIIS